MFRKVFEHNASVIIIPYWKRKSPEDYLRADTLYHQLSQLRAEFTARI